MPAVQIATRIDEQESKRFREITKALGTTPSDALRMFVAQFNAEGGFPYETKVKNFSLEAFDTEDEATAFATRLSRKTINETR
ncbi:MAG: type II toxin-antitoxin system RelB/DinJ family antitoxin [Eggerthellaceae bacterium]|jgi:DNA-damage-inducible protein J|nr:type II toxin-antitoxin system RelB/DinJ family antitoxin [Eggerthellaceae bacterium]MDR2721992.1 type II toxin-antitoxin system RelB/DinJ family antitoxin [Coriobacteriaceae bacterium]